MFQMVVYHIIAFVMSYAVVRGAPYASQLYLDEVLEEVLRAGGCGAKGGEGVSLPQILFHCLKKNPEDVFMTNGETGEKINSSQILRKAVSLARALLSKGMRGKNVMVVMRNHQTMMAVYFAVLFAGIIPFFMPSTFTNFEITHFLKLIEPCMVFCDEEHYGDVNTALQDLPKMKTQVKVANRDELLTELVNGFSDDVDNFQIPDDDVDSTVMMLPTSGSTGLPKAALMTHRGLIIQMPIFWKCHTQFPTPTDCSMVPSTPDRITFPNVVTSCVVFRVPVLMSPRKPTPEWVQNMLLTYKPSWTFFGPVFFKTLLPTLSEVHFLSLKTLIIGGAHLSIELRNALKLPSSTALCKIYGATETHSSVIIYTPDSPVECTGQVVNIFEYKLVNNDGKTVGVGQTGELYLKGLAIIKGYYKNNDVYEQSFSHDGWFKTGDLFYIDDCERFYYLERKKLCFKFMGGHVSPEEVEQVISSVAGVEECVVGDTTDGPAAVVVVHPTSCVTREQIHKAVNDTLSEHKRLHGGIAFVSSLPHTHSGKIQRAACKTLVEELLTAGEFY